MTKPVSEIAFTPSVKAVQEQLISRQHDARMKKHGGRSEMVIIELEDFLTHQTYVI